MKGMIGFAVFIVIVGVITQTWIANESSRDHGQYIGIAFDKPGKNGTMIMQVCVQQGLLMTEPADVSENGAVLLNEWVADHFKLVDASGQEVFIRRKGNSRLISDREAMNVEFFLEAKIKPGQNYTLDYIPLRASPDKYRYEFTAPTAAKKFARENFEPA